MKRIKIPHMLVLIQAILVFVFIFYSSSNSNKAQMRASDMSLKDMKKMNGNTTGIHKIDKLFDSLEVASERLDSINRVTKRKTVILRKQQNSIAKQADKIDTLVRKN